MICRYLISNNSDGGWFARIFDGVSLSSDHFAGSSRGLPLLA
jgi:hypothetical protein